jgi:hypothetical protein
MLEFVPPALILGVLLSVGFASLLHLWGGRTLQDFLLYLIASAVGFTVGQLLGVLLQIPLPRVGQIHIVEATIFAWLALIGARELVTVRRTSSRV